MEHLVGHWGLWRINGKFSMVLAGTAGPPLRLHSSHTHPALVAFPRDGSPWGLEPGPWLCLFGKSLLRPGKEVPQEESRGWVIFI